MVGVVAMGVMWPGSLQGACATLMAATAEVASVSMHRKPG